MDGRAPRAIAERPVWAFHDDDVEIRFVGRGPEGDRESVLAEVAPEAPALAWARQIHSATVLEAAPGGCGDGDALVTERRDVTLSVITADCVPIVLAGDRWTAAVHAGWRGIASGIVGATLAGRPGPVRAWIGPAIGPCCYEVGEEVARAVTAASSPEVVHRQLRARPRLDLGKAVARQLASRAEIRGRIDTCTRCRPELLWSYRREGPRAGRNLTFVWRRS